MLLLLFLERRRRKGASTSVWPGSSLDTFQHHLRTHMMLRLVVAIERRTDGRCLRSLAWRRTCAAILGKRRARPVLVLPTKVFVLRQEMASSMSCASSRRRGRQRKVSEERHGVVITKKDFEKNMTTEGFFLSIVMMMPDDSLKV